MNKEEIWRAVGQITIRYSLLECDQCAIAVMKFLQENGMTGRILRLSTKRRNEIFIISDRHNQEESITENGTHYGVEVFGKVFDNLSAEGLAREDWLNSFHCLSEQFLLNELDSLEELGEE